MGKHRKGSDETWDDKTPEEKGSMFDESLDYSARVGEEKRRNGKYPYDFDHVTQPTAPSTEEPKRSKWGRKGK